MNRRSCTNQRAIKGPGRIPEKGPGSVAARKEEQEITRAKKRKEYRKENGRG